MARWLPPGQNSVNESLKTLVKNFVQCFFFNIIASTCLKLYYLFFVWPIFFRKAFFYKIYQSLFERQSLPGRPTTFGLGREGGDKVGQQWHLAQSMCFLSIWTVSIGHFILPLKKNPNSLLFTFVLMKNGCFLPGSLYVFSWSAVTRLSNKYRRITNEVESAVMMTRQLGPLFPWIEKKYWFLSPFLFRCCGVWAFTS